MREIKFRGKDVDSGEWRNGSLVTYPNGRCEIVVFDDSEILEYEVDVETVGQFTGLHDKDGKEIYEGDMIYLCHFFVQYCPYEHKPIRGAYDVEVDKDGINTVVSYKRNYVVEFRPNRGWIVRNGSVHHSLRSYAGVAYGEVIGNIHDNPNLLTDGRD